MKMKSMFAKLAGPGELRRSQPTPLNFVSYLALFFAFFTGGGMPLSGCSLSIGSDR